MAGLWGNHGDHAGKHAPGGATAPGVALVSTAVPVQGDTAATIGPTQGMLRSRSARD